MQNEGTCRMYPARVSNRCEAQCASTGSSLLIGDKILDMTNRSEDTELFHRRLDQRKKVKKEKDFKTKRKMNSDEKVDGLQNAELDRASKPRCLRRWKENMAKN
jgi:hypothetical protein